MRYAFSMSSITLRNVPVHLHRTLKLRAKANGRTLNKEIIATLQGRLSGDLIHAEKVGERARAVRESMGVYLTQNDLRVLKNTGRR